MSISHLMLLTLTTALAISMMNFVASQWNAVRSPGPPDTVMDVLRVAARLWTAGILGMDLALAWIVLAWMVEKRPQHVAPGHWLLLGLGVDAVLSVILNGFSALLLTGGWQYEITGYLRLCMFGMGELVMGAVWFGFSAHVPGTWRVVLVLQGILSTVSAAGWLLMAFARDNFNSPFGILNGLMLVAIGGLGVFVPGLAAIVLAIHDRVEQRPRDWLHVLGAMLIALQIVGAVLYRLIPPV